MPTTAVLGAPGQFAATPTDSPASAPSGPRPSPPDLKTWQSTLLTDRAPRIYRSDLHTDARMHMGGIGTGNIELGVDGRFTGWNLFNTLQEGEVPLHFAIHAGGQARLLQTSAGPDGPHVPLITMRGEYPIADLEFHDELLPVKVSLQAMTPLVPMDERTSSVPAIHLEFSLRNESDTAQPAAIAGMMLNPVGYEGAGEIRANRHAALGGNINRYLSSGGQSSLEMLAESMDSRPLQHPVVVFADRARDDRLWRRLLPPGLIFRPLSDLPAATKAADGSLQSTVVWLDSPDLGLPVSVLD
ncbi:MAG: hypothetical protein LC772_11395, partial [Chloroflexi bacterium]|nr:hypothetical protein [Chloroflexota bacterium]